MIFPFTLPIKSAVLIYCVMNSQKQSIDNKLSKNDIQNL